MTTSEPTTLYAQSPFGLMILTQTLLELLVQDKADHEALTDVAALQRAVTKSVGVVKRIAQRYAKSA